MSEQLLLINPRRRRRRKMSAKQRKYFGKRRRTRARRAPSRIRARRRHRVAAHTAVRRRRRYRVRAHMSNPRRARRAHRRYRARHFNPRFNVRGIVRETLVPAGIGAGGAILTDIAYAYASPYLPAALQSGMLPVVAKLAVALGVGFAAGKVSGRRIGTAVTLGGVTVVAYGALRGALSSALPTVKGLSGGLQDYVDYSTSGRTGAYMKPPGMGFISPAPMLGPATGSGRTGAYMPPAGSLNGMDGAYDWRNDGM